MRELSPLEQVDIIEYERKETTLRYMDQCAMVVSNAKSKEMAEQLLEILKNEYFIGIKDNEKKKATVAAAELAEIQKYAFVAVPSPRGSILEVRKKPNG
jgi:hypothetical protein